jgi:hypothetical protein
LRAPRANASRSLQPALGTHGCLTPQVADKKRAGRSAQWWCGSGVGARACPYSGVPARTQRIGQGAGRTGERFSYQPSAISFQPRGRADGGKIQLSAFSYQLSAKGPGGRGKNSAISLQLSAFSQGAGRPGGNGDALNLPHHPARGDHRQTSRSCDEDPLGSLRLLGNCRKPGAGGIRRGGRSIKSRSSG